MPCLLCLRRVPTRRDDTTHSPLVGTSACSRLPGCRPAPCFRSSNEEESELRVPSRTPAPLAQLSCLSTTVWSGECVRGRCSPSHSLERAPLSPPRCGRLRSSGPGCAAAPTARARGAPCGALGASFPSLLLQLLACSCCLLTLTWSVCL